jgi:hypothetical protein
MEAGCKEMEEKMKEQDITPDMRVWEVIQEHPETFEVFRRHGCPDMRSGIFALSAHVMKVKWAAKMHRIPLDELMTDLNQAVHHEEQKEEILH